MRHLVLIAIITFLSACGDSPRSDLASSFVIDVMDPDATCKTIYLDEGADHVYAARCKLPSKREVVYCSISISKGLTVDTVARVAPSPEAAPSSPARPPFAPPLPPKAP